MSTEIQEHHLIVDRSARYYTLGPLDDPVRQLWIVCHGFAQLAGRFIRHFQSLDSGERLIVAPEALNRFYIDSAPGMHGPESKVGGTWMTREDRLHEIADYVRYLDRVAATMLARLESIGATPTVHVLGFSQGVATVARWVAQGTVRPAQLVLWSAPIPPEMDSGPALEKLRAVPHLSLVIGTLDEGLQKMLANGEEERIRRLGLHDRLVRFEGAHHLDPATLLMLAESAAAD
jgi:predicted esterase